MLATLALLATATALFASLQRLERPERDAFAAATGDVGSATVAHLAAPGAGPVPEPRRVAAVSDIQSAVATGENRALTAALVRPVEPALETGASQHGFDRFAPGAAGFGTALPAGTGDDDIMIHDPGWRVLRVAFHEPGGTLLAEGARLAPLPDEAAPYRIGPLSAIIGLALFAGLVLAAGHFWVRRALRRIDIALQALMHSAADDPVRGLPSPRTQPARSGDVASLVRTIETLAAACAERQRLHRSATHDATHDPLTGLANRAFFQHQLEQKLQQALANRPEQSGLLVMIDIDHFKILNDTRGHQAGDRLLTVMAKRLTDHVGAEGRVARLGGDEFALIVTNDAAGQDARSIVDGLFRVLSRAAEIGGEPYIPSVSIGVTRFPEDAVTPQGLLINGDIALFEAKRNGRNQWHFFETAMRETLEHREHVRKTVARALASDALGVVFQPICCIRTGAHLGFEVLTRLECDGQTIPPMQFIPIAEEYGMIGALGKNILNKAAHAQRSMLDRGLDPGQMSLNVAPQQLRDPGFFETLQDALYRHALDPGRICIEITETALIGRSLDTVAQTLLRCKSAGMQIALDDFGTGFSSLSHLRNFSVDKIKIDKSFVTDIESNRADHALVDGVVGLADKLGLKVVAEGVETQGQLDDLRAIGCHYAQGYLFARPMALEDALRFLERGDGALYG
jgi:diguanylate cyclase (GGDEF)-like protein